MTGARRSSRADLRSRSEVEPRHQRRLGEAGIRVVLTPSARRTPMPTPSGSSGRLRRSVSIASFPSASGTSGGDRRVRRALPSRAESSRSRQSTHRGHAGNRRDGPRAPPPSGLAGCSISMSGPLIVGRPRLEHYGLNLGHEVRPSAPEATVSTAERAIADATRATYPA